MRALLTLFVAAMAAILVAGLASMYDAAARERGANLTDGEG
jgi:cbb3-type cytochrome oxidase subunit 3